MSAIRNPDPNAIKNETVWAYQQEDGWHCITCDDLVDGPGGHQCEEE